MNSPSSSFPPITTALIAPGGSLSILAHNLLRSFQLHSALATPKPRSRKRTYAYRIASMKTLRLRFINRAARLARISGRKVVRFAPKESLHKYFGISVWSKPLVGSADVEVRGWGISGRSHR